MQPFLHTTQGHVPHLLQSELPKLRKVVYLNELMDYEKVLRFDLSKYKDSIFTLYNPTTTISRSSRLVMNSKYPNSILCTHKSNTQVFHEDEYYSMIIKHDISQFTQLHNPMHYRKEKHLEYFQKALLLKKRFIPVIYLSDIAFLDTILENTKPSMIWVENDTDKPLLEHSTLFNNLTSNNIVSFCPRLDSFNDILYCKQNNLVFDTYLCEYLVAERKAIVNSKIILLSDLANSPNKKLPLQSDCSCEGCTYSSYYIQHLLDNNEISGKVCLMQHNLTALATL